MVLSQDDCSVIIKILDQLNYKLDEAKKVLAIREILQSSIDGKEDISIANKEGKVKEAK
jgi:hypothetical protein